ncbi:MAG: glycosyl hydrolase family 2 [Bacteroides sp.]|nr:glycosyl hydrolase family 2 [Bacteroides sp.]
MKKTALISLLCLSSLTAAAQQWPVVNPEARPGTRWWWMGSAVDSANLRYNIGEYAKAGIGSVEITPIYGVKGNDANEIPYLSDEWMNALRITQAEAAANGVLVDMNQGTGWPFGGPEVPIEDAACKAIFLVDTVAPGAEPIKTVGPKEEDIAKLIATSRRALPTGDEEVIRVYESRTRQAVKRAAPGGEGFVIDHFDRDVVKKYLDKFGAAFDSRHAAYPHNFFNDSYEVYGANWTPTLFDEFERRRGYRLQDKLPELLGFVDDCNAVLSDYRETLGDMLLENFTEQWTQWANERGVETRNQAHGSPANLIDIYAAVDVPEIEGFGLSDFGIKGLRTDPGFTRKNDSDVSMLKYASSAAHIAGKPLASSETFTWLTEHFRTALSQMKPDIDLMFTCGVNHMFYHGTTYSPREYAWPGWKFYASVDMSPTNTIWRDASALNEYITRCQSFLQMGNPDNDYLVYLPVRDMWRERLSPAAKGIFLTFDIHGMKKKAPGFIKSILEIDSLGFDCDYISDKYLMTTEFKDGMLTTAAGTRYRGLIIPGSGNLTPQLQAHLDSLKAQGATIIMGVDEAAIKAGAKSEAMRTDLKLRAIRRSNPEGHHYFIANLTPEDVNDAVPLAVEFVDAAWFDPMTGEIYKAEVADGKVVMNFRSGESRILQTYDHKLDVPVRSRDAVNPDTINLTDREWKLSFIESVPEVKRQFKLSSLKPWTELGDSELNDLAGTGVYTTTFNMDKKELAGDWSIDLGDVRESARVYLNGKYIGCAWAVPFTLSCGDALKRGKNELRIEVTNLPANRIAALDRQGEQWRIFKEINIVDIAYKKTTYEGWETVPGGLNSTVKLIRR